MAERDAWEQSLHRFARILLGDEAAAQRVTLAVIEDAIRRPPAHGDAERLGLFLCQEVRRRALKEKPAAAFAERPSGELPAAAAAAVQAATPARVEEALHALAEPGRSALALLLLDPLEADTIARLLGLGRAEFAAAVGGARAALHAALSPAEVVS